MTVNYQNNELDTKRMVLNFGPQHPSMHGTLRCVLELDGEVVVKATPHMGYLHTGFEKLAEYRTWNQVVPITDRMNYLSPMSNNIGYAQAVEELMGIELPPKAQYVRVIMAELSRFADHVISVGLHGMDLGAFTVMLWGFIEREKAYDLFEIATGGRLTTSYTRIGGLARDIPPEFIPALKSKLGKFMSIVDEIEYMLSNNRIFMDRTQGVGTITKEDAINWGVSGPSLRACGIEWDIRKSRPYLCYKDLDFIVPIAAEGDTYARYKVRCEEMRQSIRIIEQCLAKLPDGPVNIFDHKARLPEKEEVYNTIEGLIHHFKLIMHGDQHGMHPPKGEVYSCTEVPNGNLGFFLISDGTGKPYRMRVRPPSLYHYQLFGKIAEGAMIADLVAIMSSFNVIAGELDR